MKVNFPSKDEERLSLLRQMVDKAQQDAANGNFLLSAQVVGRVADMAERFAAALWLTQQKGEERTQYIQEADEAVAALRKAVQNIWSQVRWQLEWREISPPTLEYYALDRQGRQPRLKSRQDWLTLGNKILTGDESARMRGYPGVQDIDLLSQLCAQAKTALDRLSATKLAYSEASAALAKLRRESERSGRRAVATLRLALSEKSESTQREIMRAYGVQFAPAASTANSTSSQVGSTTSVEEEALPTMTRTIPMQLNPTWTTPAAPFIPYPTTTLYPGNGVPPTLNCHGAA
ncbi:MAG: hypothetical protein R2911_37915 [Caldilineaceae bacterium]